MTTQIEKYIKYYTLQIQEDKYVQMNPVGI